MIVISAQYGDPQSCTVLRPIHKTLNGLFIKYMKNNYFRSIKKLSIVWRVSGKVASFGEGEGPERLKYFKKKQYITVDLVIQEYQWKNKKTEEIKQIIVDGTNRCFQMLLKRAEKESEIFGKELIINDYNKAIDDFNKMEEFTV